MPFFFKYNWLHMFRWAQCDYNSSWRNHSGSLWTPEMLLSAEKASIVHLLFPYECEIKSYFQWISNSSKQGPMVCRWWILKCTGKLIIIDQIRHPNRETQPLCRPGIFRDKGYRSVIMGWPSGGGEHRITQRSFLHNGLIEKGGDHPRYARVRYPPKIEENVFILLSWLLN